MQKAVILVSQKRKESRNIAARMPMLIYANTPPIGLQIIMKKSSPEALLLDKGSSKNFLVEARGIEPLSESLFTRPSPGASVYLNSLSMPGNGTLHGQVAS